MVGYEYFVVPLTEEESLAHYGVEDKRWGISRSLAHKDRTIQDIIDEMSPEEKDFQALIVGAALDNVDVSGDAEIVSKYNELSDEKKFLIDFTVGNLLADDSSLKHSDEFDDETLAHFGVKGMRWGVRRSDTPSLSRTSSAESRAKARAKVKSGSATLGEAHVAALKSTGHRAINAFSGDKTFWKRMAITAGVTGAVLGAAAAAPYILPAGVLTAIGGTAVSAAGGTSLAGYTMAGGSLTSLSSIGAATVGSTLAFGGAYGGIAATVANVVGNTARAVGGNARINKSYAGLGKTVVARQTEGNKRVQKILNKSGSLAKRDLKHSVLEEFVSDYGSTLLKHAEARGPSEAPASRPSGKKGGGKFDESKVKRDGDGKFSTKAGGDKGPKNDAEWEKKLRDGDPGVLRGFYEAGGMKRVAVKAAADLGIKAKDLSMLKEKHVEAALPYYIEEMNKFLAQPRYISPSGTKRIRLRADGKSDTQIEVVPVRK